MSAPNLQREFYFGKPEVIAQRLLGKRLVSRIGGKLTSGLIIETEAYLAANDPAAHSARGLTKSNAAMFGVPGHAYVYPIHAKYCFNVVVLDELPGSAVLIRSLEPERGLKTMAARRGTDDSRSWTTGPGRLCSALGIDRAIDHMDLTTRRTVWIEDSNELTFDLADVMTTPRIGVTSAEELMLRFCIANNRYVSGPKKWRWRD